MTRRIKSGQSAEAPEPLTIFVNLITCSLTQLTTLICVHHPLILKNSQYLNTIVLHHADFLWYCRVSMGSVAFVLIHLPLSTHHILHFVIFSADPSSHPAMFPHSRSIPGSLGSTSGSFNILPSPHDAASSLHYDSPHWTIKERPEHMLNSLVSP
jgi:hypothetical protein